MRRVTADCAKARDGCLARMSTVLPFLNRGGPGSTVSTTAPVPTSAPKPKPKESDHFGGDLISVGVPKESAEGESRVAIVPANVAMLRAKGMSSVLVESNAGLDSEFEDETFAAAGATICRSEEAWGADIVFHIRPPTAPEAAMMRPGAVLVSFMQHYDNQHVVDILRTRGVTVLSMDLVPRISRAQWFDALSSMANIAGYRAVMEASNLYGRYFCRQSTAAGTSQPARVLIIGCGVAGLQAIATAKRLGCEVRCMDPRSETRAQVESLGAAYVEVPFKEDGSGSGGYAKQMSEAYMEAQRQTVHRECLQADVVITTAMLVGKPAPRVILADTCAAMKHGSVIIDLAAERGGNCELTQADKTVVLEDNNVRVVGDTNLVSRMAPQASTMYGNNVTKLLLYALPAGSTGSPQERLRSKLQATLGDASPNPEADALLLWMTVCHEGRSWVPVDVHYPWLKQLLWPPKPVESQADAEVRERALVEAKEAERRTDLLLSGSQVALAALTFGGMLAVGAFAPASFVSVSTLGLSLIIGYHTVHTCEAGLHSPFMSLTNALSGVAVIGGVVLSGGGFWPQSAAQALGNVSVFLASMNLFGGFRVTHRTLNSLANKKKAHGYLPLWVYSLPAGLGCGIIAGSAIAGAPMATALSGMIPIGYLAAGLLTAGSMATFTSPELARVGNVLGASAMTLGAVTAVAQLYPPAAVLCQLAVTAGLGAVGGLVVAENMEGAQELPQMVALFHSSVGLAATLSSIGSFLTLAGPAYSAAVIGHKIAISAAVVMGSITCTGSLVAFAKLAEMIPGRSLALPGRDVWNIGLAAVTMGQLIAVCAVPNTWVSLGLLLGGTATSGILGAHLTSAIGGADMPVVVTVLNSYSGWALVAEGFLMHNILLLTCGSLIGASGAKLTTVMCHGMNRSLTNVLFGGYGTQKKAIGKVDGQVTETSAVEIAHQLATSQKVIIVPGYGLAQARAQHALAAVGNLLRDARIDTCYAVHAVAGRMPGQMNCLLGEAEVPYEMVKEGDEVNDKFTEADVVLVVGANDICNSLAEDPDSELAGMPVLKVWQAKQVYFLKRSLGAGYAGIDNPVFFNPNTALLLGDAKRSCEGIASALRDRLYAAGVGGDPLSPVAAMSSHGGLTSATAAAAAAAAAPCKDGATAVPMPAAITPPDGACVGTTTVVEGGSSVADSSGPR
eukprot:TRINITY_DN3107_c0_g1_i1.p1 TRINITY_DN3107_c0_g1~~TRINITY_DN3107_c0_g1_i1.p1  ORF type:complete len:1187 (-),score=342.38 TRINITY_DN3107_c0_g1_i1:235-3795(-)